MPTLYNKSFSIDELQRMTGSMDQLAGIRLVEYSSGRMHGMRAADVWTGSGLRFTVLLDRGMDIGPAEFAGKPLAWLHPAMATPTFYEPVGGGFGRTFGGGLLVTCGLNHFGPSETVGGEFFPQHGRASHIPADEVNTHCGWDGDTYRLEVEGKVCQAILYGENLLLTRRISTSLGATSLHIEDRVANQGYRTASLMMLYHCNFGFPLISPDSELVVDEESVSPRDEPARAGLGQQNYFGAPEADFQQQVFFHRPRPAADGYATATLVNRAIDFGAFLRYRTAELPVLTQWKNTGAGDYLCGLEPATNPEAPRETLRQRGEMKLLAPGEEVCFSLEIGIAG